MDEKKIDWEAINKGLKIRIFELENELEKLQSEHQNQTLDYWESHGKVEAYEFCIKAFTGKDVE